MLTTVHQSFRNTVALGLCNRAVRAPDRDVFFDRANRITVEPRDSKPQEVEQCTELGARNVSAALSERDSVLTLRFDNELLCEPSGLEYIDEAESVALVFGRALGGNCEVAWSIIDKLNAAGKPTRATILETCCSAHSLIFIAADERHMRANAQLMIHGPTGAAYGTPDEMRQTLRSLEASHERQIDFYAERTEIDRSIIERWLAEGDVWLSADEAATLGVGRVISRIKLACFA